jgi:hypothetical protein
LFSTRGEELRVFCSPVPVLCHGFSYPFFRHQRQTGSSDDGERVGLTTEYGHLSTDNGALEERKRRGRI